ncbi:MAG: hypothetical protein PHU80_11760, partial [Kiritimatiellae bacterium]|nr:hypothetical protein [Kiritimatiellia bacterium]
MRNKRTTAARWLAAAVTAGACTAGAVPLVSNVSMTQRQNSRMVDIAYVLSGEEAIITLSIETNGVALPERHVTRLSGDVCKKVQPAAEPRQIVWDAGADWPENLTESARARITAWLPSCPPACLVVDLNEGPATNVFPVNYYASTEALPYGGLTNDIYKGAYLVMKRLP